MGISAQDEEEPNSSYSMKAGLGSEEESGVTIGLESDETLLLAYSSINCGIG